MTSQDKINEDIQECTRLLYECSDLYGASNGDENAWDDYFDWLDRAVDEDVWQVVVYYE